MALTRLKLPAIFLITLLVAGFFAEHTYYSYLFKDEAVTSPGGATKIVVLGGSISSALKNTLQSELERIYPGHNFSVVVYSFAFLSSAQSLIAYRQAAQKGGAQIVLLQVGCNETHQAPLPERESEKLSALVQGNSIKNWDPFLETAQFERITDLIDVALRHNNPALLQQISHVTKFRKLTALSPAHNQLLASQIQSALNFYFKKLGDPAADRIFFTLLNFGFYHRQAVFPEQQTNPIGGLPPIHRDNSINEKSAREYLEALDTWAQRGLAEILRTGCGEFLKNPPISELYARYWLCGEWRKGQLSGKEIFEDQVMAYSFILALGDGDLPALPRLSGNFARKFATAIEKRHLRSESAMNDLAPDVTENIEANLRILASEARQQGTALVLLHYPNNRFPALVGISERLGIASISGTDIFPRASPEQLLASYFVDSSECGGGHLNSVGSLYYARRVAKELGQLGLIR